MNTELKHKVGDTVVITGNLSGHGYNIGDTTIITEIEYEYSEYIGAADCDNQRWYLEEGDFVLYDDNNCKGRSQMNTELKHRVGDTVVITGNTIGHGYTLGKALVIASIDKNDSLYYGPADFKHGLSYCFGDDDCVLKVDSQEGETVNYNDGKWHEWHGGSNPVHPESEVHFTLRGGSTNGQGALSDDLSWDKSGKTAIVFFRVSEVYKRPEPKEYWFVKDSNECEYTKLPAYPAGSWDEVIHVKEVVK